MKQINVLCIAGLLGLSGTALAVEYSRVLPAQSRLAFVSKQMGVPVEGQFDRYALKLNFDPARLEAAKAVLEIDLASIDAGSREANEEVVGPNWFNVRRHPTARFESSSLNKLDNGRYELRGRMSLKGQAANLAIPITITSTGKTGVLEGGFVLKRLEWGIGTGAWGDPGTVADEVQIKFRFVAEAADQLAQPARKH